MREEEEGRRWRNGQKVQTSGVSHRLTSCFLQVEVKLYRSLLMREEGRPRKHVSVEERSGV